MQLQWKTAKILCMLQNILPLESNPLLDSSNLAPYVIIISRGEVHSMKYITFNNGFISINKKVNFGCMPWNKVLNKPYFCLTGSERCQLFTDAAWCRHLAKTVAQNIRGEDIASLADYQCPWILYDCTNSIFKKADSVTYPAIWEKKSTCQVSFLQLHFHKKTTTK